jgi:hypothetical protein
LALSVMVDVPFAKCMCVDAATHCCNPQRYMMDNCYYFAPMHLKPTILGLIEVASSGHAANMRTSCIAMVEFTKSGLTSLMQPWFDAQLKSTEAMASSIDYLLLFVSSKAGRYHCIFFFHACLLLQSIYMMYPLHRWHLSACFFTSSIQSRCSNGGSCC